MLGFNSSEVHAALLLLCVWLCCCFLHKVTREHARSFVLDMDPCLMYEWQRNPSAEAIAVLLHWRIVEYERWLPPLKSLFWSYKYDNESLVALKCYADVQSPRGHFILKMWIHFQGLKIILRSPAGTTDKNVRVTLAGCRQCGGALVVLLLFFFPPSACLTFVTLCFFPQQRILRTSADGRLHQKWNGLFHSLKCQTVHCCCYFFFFFFNKCSPKTSM